METARFSLFDDTSTYNSRPVGAREQERRAELGLHYSRSTVRTAHGDRLGQGRLGRTTDHSLTRDSQL